MNIDEFAKDRKAIEFPVDGLNALRCPGVYMYLAGDEALYIGASRKVVGRILARNHHITKGLEYSTSLMIFPCDSWQSAKELETQMITTLRPRLNRRNYKTTPAKDLAAKLGISVTRTISAYLTD